MIYYADWEGNICAPGEDAGRFAAWPDIRIYDVVICVDHCNNTLTDSRVVTPNFDIDLDIVEDLINDDENSTISIEGYETDSILSAYCIPTLDSISSVIDVNLEDDYDEFLGEYSDEIDAIGETLSLALDDLFVTRYLLIASAFTALIVSLTWGWFIRHFGGVIVWTSIIFTLIGIITIAYYMIDFSETAYTFGYDTIGNIMYYGGIALVCLDCIFFLAICFMWHRIRLAIALAKETTRALNSMWGMFFYPIVPCLAFVFYLVYWCAGMWNHISVVDFCVLFVCLVSLTPKYHTVCPQKLLYKQNKKKTHSFLSSHPFLLGVVIRYLNFR